MTRKIIATGFLILAVLAIRVYLVGSHGRLMFRPHMTEDWIIGGIAVYSGESIPAFRWKGGQGFKV